MLGEMDPILEQGTNWKISLWHYSVLWFAESETTGGFILEETKAFRQFLTGSTELLFIFLSTAQDAPMPGQGSGQPWAVTATDGGDSFPALGHQIFHLLAFKPLKWECLTLWLQVWQ